MDRPRHLRRRLRLWDATEKAAVSAVLPRRRRRGSTWFGRLGDVAQQPPVWAALAAVMALLGGPRGRQAAMRGATCYGLAAGVVNFGIKPVVGRRRPPGAGEGRPGPVTSSFPSGHTATDLAFSLGAAQEIPAVFVPLTVVTMAAHWSMIRSRGHYPSDVLVGGAVAVAVALAARWVSPPGKRVRRGRSEGVPPALDGRTDAAPPAGTGDERGASVDTRTGA